MNPSFDVPAPYFYALAASLPLEVSAAVRYRLATQADEATTIDVLRRAIDSGAIAEDPLVTVEMAARRLRALGSTDGVTPVCASGVGLALTTGYAGYYSAVPDPDPAADIEPFWASVPGTPALARAHLELVLCAITQEADPRPLITAVVGEGFALDSVANLDAAPWPLPHQPELTFADWAKVFTDHPDLLPAAIGPGTLEERIAAFVRMLQAFFNVTTGALGPGPTTPEAVPLLPRPGQDLIQGFFDAYRAAGHAGWEWGQGLDDGARDTVIGASGLDPQAAAWLGTAVTVLDALYGVTAIAGIDDRLHFSLAEALYARGFTDRGSITALGAPDFAHALIGTPAHPFATAVHQAAGGSSIPDPGPDGPFAPVNPGDLVNCTSPCELSELGDVAYLQDVLTVRAGTDTLGTRLADRAGPLGDLAATRADATIPIPLIDLVNESLEAMTAGAPHGVVHDTDPADAGDHEPADWFRAVPSYSSPAVPVAEPTAYDALAQDFSAPELPYDQRLDVNRRYLEVLGTTRFDVLRGFRHDITEFVLDRAGEPVAFPRQLWRYPVRLDLALEYLCLSRAEYETLFEQTPAGATLARLYGFGPDTERWQWTAARLSELLPRLGLDYCALVELLATGFLPARVRLTGAGEGGPVVTLPDCEPCCLADYVLEFDAGDTSGGEQVGTREAGDPWAELAVFVRLWRALRCTAALPVAELVEVCEVLGLFDAAGQVDPDFVPQLAALLMLRADFRLPHLPVPVLLDLWRDPAAVPADRIEQLLDAVAERAQHRHHGRPRPPEFRKLLRGNLDALSALGGFDPADAALTWHAKPTHTLRFAEQLTKIHASAFGIGELVLLCTADGHLAGDDPYPLQSATEAEVDPLHDPDDVPEHSLWRLRHELLAVEPDTPTVESYTWQRIGDVLRDELGGDQSGADLQALGGHLFPGVLAAAGQPVAPAQQRYQVHLGGSSAQMWNTPGSPFRYDDPELSAAVPLTEEAVLTKLSRIRPLRSEEQQAVRDLVAAPRRELVGFGYLFPDLDAAWEHLVAEPDENARWRWFRERFALFHARCGVVARHLADHVLSLDGGDADDDPDGTPARRPATEAMARRLLRVLPADENFADPGPWELDDGHRPPLAWGPSPVGSAFAAITGLIGTGLLAEHRPVGAATPLWRALQATTALFDPVRDAWNAPVPTIVPALDSQLSSTQRRWAEVRNGIGVSGHNARTLGGVQAFASRWSGLLLVEHDGTYTFWGSGARSGTGQGTPGPDAPGGEHWQVRLGRGQKQWTLLSHDWGEHPDCAGSAGLTLRRGVYDLTVELVRDAPGDDEIEDARPLTCGLRIEYQGPDTGGERTPVPTERLYLADKDARLDDGIDPEALGGVPRDLLRHQYVSTLRDVRRSYQRAFKALLLAHRFDLSAELFSDYAQSELGYLLDHGAQLAGTAFYRQGGWQPHHVDFDPALLPLLDTYRPSAADDRGHPSVRRRQAWFDVWERLFDHTDLRARARTAPEAPVWLLYDEAAENQPDNPAQLLRHLGIELGHAPLVLGYDSGYAVTAADLTDERWPVRVWHADQLVRRIVRRFLVADLAQARPDLWAAADPLGSGGNANLTALVRAGYLDNGEPVRFTDLRRLDDCLREHARDALVAHLTRLDRVPLPGGGYATSADQLTDLLLIDVSTGVRARSTRIAAAVAAVQTFVGRARLGLEAQWQPSAEFVAQWDRRYDTCERWARERRGELYRENRTGRIEQDRARRTEAFRFLEQELRRATLTVPVPGGLAHWSAVPPPAHPGLELLQQRDASALTELLPARQGLDLLGTPERGGARSWLSALPRPARDGGGGFSASGGAAPEEGRQVGSASAGAQQGAPADGGSAPADGGAAPVDGQHAHAAAVTVPRGRAGTVPLWIEAAIRLGVTFLRVPAAAVPPASRPFAPPAATEGCSCGCEGRHRTETDEYYFWLVDSARFDQIQQVADWPGWHEDAAAAALLEWPAKPLVHLMWCQLHDGELRQPRRSFAGLAIPDGAGPGSTSLTLVGRERDSLLFAVGGGQLTPGAAAPPDPGFRYDLASDEAVVVPTVTPPKAVKPQDYPGLGALPAYPYFVYFAPGAPLFPGDPFAETITVGCALRGRCAHEAATHWYAVTHNPATGDNRWCRHQVSALDRGGDRTVGDVGPRFGGCCDGTGADEETARRRYVTLEYLETLLEWADCAVREHTAAGRTRARLVLDSAARILGPTPLSVRDCACGTRPVTTVADGDGPGRAVTVSSFEPCGVPLNPWLMSLFERVADRRAVLRAEPGPDSDCCGTCGGEHCGCRNHGSPAGRACGGEAGCCCPPSPYRFSYVLGRAADFANQVTAFGAELQAALEKGDVELLAAVRARHEQQVLNLNRAIRKEQWRDADWQLQGLRVAKQIAQTHHDYYDGLINRGLIGGERDYQALTNSSAAAVGAATVSEAIGTVMGVIPDVFVGTSDFTQLPLGTKLEHVFAGIARISGQVATILAGTAGLRNTEGGWVRRQAEWQYQRELAGLEIAQAERQILAAERRRAAALGELNTVQRQIENAREVGELLRDKATSHAHFLWLQKELAVLYRQMYELAGCTVRQAEHAFNVERGFTDQRFVPDGSWHDLHDGLTAGQQLTLAVRRMDAAYTTDNVREYELTKHVSLRKYFGAAFLDLKVNGECVVELPEWLFDLDYPGHYLRRLKSVSLTVPAVVGPFTGLHARLTLLANTIRVVPTLAGPEGECCTERPAARSGGCGCGDCGSTTGCGGGDCARCADGCCPEPGSAAGYALRPGDCRAVRDHGNRQAIATSSGQNDAGLFELSFRDERYLPFEYSGAVSTWKLEIPPGNNDFDLDTLSDAILHVNYTAREGGPVLRRAAEAHALDHLPDAGERLIDVAREMPEEWAAFTGERRGRRLDLRLSRDFFACVTSGRAVRVRKLELFMESRQARPSTHVDVEFEVAAGARCEPDAEYSFTLVGGADRCGFQYGAVAVTAGPISGYQPELVGSFEFEEPVPEVTRVFVLVHYELTGCGSARPSGQRRHQGHDRDRG
ncbi:neuraminidase-like domain-containing protein [Kitasatospora sp. NPDC058965]|uniref:Tc toxin subunit A-related protein n=1 Tax=Kitasatospora sp. NPDC058965 TaxID=3346682 RepID=UPI003689B925